MVPQRVRGLSSCFASQDSGVSAGVLCPAGEGAAEPTGPAGHINPEVENADSGIYDPDQR